VHHPADLDSIEQLLDEITAPPVKVHELAAERMASDAARKITTAKCKSCDAPIMWAPTENGKSIPLDPAPVEGGNVQIDADGTAHVLGSAPLDAQPLHISHFATCPTADQHRKPKPVVDDGEGGPVDEADFNLLADKFNQLPPETIAWFKTLVTAANDAGVSFLAKPPIGRRTLRRYSLYRGLINLGRYLAGEHTYDHAEADEILLAIVHEAFPNSRSIRSWVAVGAILGEMGTDEAAAFAHAVDDVIANRRHIIALPTTGMLTVV
jgi:hypothetical protein